MDDIQAWDEDYLKAVILPATESGQLEKKASGKFVLTNKGQPDGPTKDELAKQVSAFANSGSGHVVYGITDDNQFDAGIPMTIGNQPTKDWVEAQIPKLVFPSITNCSARLIQVNGIHAVGQSLLVIAVPLSDRRPHWIVTGNEEVAYIRAGAHSLPMRPQSMLDIASRQGASSAEIVNVRRTEYGKPNEKHVFYRIMPYVQLINGRMCPDWAIQIDVAK